MAKILIVDDLSTHRRFLVALLAPHGHTIVEAANGQDGLAAADLNRPDLIITDILMPVMDGYEFVRRLRLDPITTHIPVLFYTAPYGEREARTFARSIGLPFVLTKPGKPDEVLQIVGRVLAGDLDSKLVEFGDAVGEDRDHLQLLSDQLSDSAADLKDANARLRALINIGMDLASSRGSDRLIQSVCNAACDLFGASYVSLGIVDRDTDVVRRFATCGTSTPDWMEPGDTVAGVMQTLMSSRHVLRVDDVDASATVFPPGHPPVDAFLAVPISSRLHVYGWICLAGIDGRIFSGRDEPMVQALAGQVGRIYELEYEILERKQAEAARRQERDRAQQFLDAAAVVMLGLDLDGRITLLNRAGCELLGWSEAELLGREWIDTCLPVRIRSWAKEALQTVVQEGATVLENPVLTRTGDERLVEWRNTVVRDATGTAVGTLSSGTDVTVRDAAVEALRVAEERMRFALESANVGIWDMDYTTGVLRWSDIMERQYGLDPGSFAGTFEAFLSRVHKDDRDAMLSTIDAATASGDDFSVMNRSVWPDGTVRWLSGAGRVLRDEHGTPLRGVGISLDVTDARQLEQQQRQGQRMEAVGRLAAGIAHDFNNLLTVILGYSDILADGVGSDIYRGDEITQIQAAGIRAVGLTRQLLAFSRKQIIEPTGLDLNVIVAGMQPMLRRLIREDIKVVLRLQPSSAPILADHGQIEQLVMNLATNARDAMPKGGALIFETCRVQIDERNNASHRSVVPGPYVILTVSDTGTGMTPQVQAHLFEPFFTTKDLGSGTGLGLATVQAIVARSGASISVSSEPGMGSTFKVYFPENLTVQTVDHVSADAPARTGTETILVVEDAPDLRGLTTRLLERLGYKVLVAESAAEAMRVFAENGGIDLVLTDVVMPGTSGPDLTEQLVAQRANLKVVFMSGYAETTVVQDGVVKPGIAFLHKPFTSTTLGDKIRETLDG